MTICGNSKNIRILRFIWESREIYNSQIFINFILILIRDVGKFERKFSKVYMLAIHIDFEIVNNPLNKYNTKFKNKIKACNNLLIDSLFNKFKPDHNLIPRLY